MTNITLGPNSGYDLDITGKFVSHNMYDFEASIPAFLIATRYVSWLFREL